MSSHPAIQIIGLLGYAGVVGLAVLWAFIGAAYLRAGRPRTTWLLFVVAMCCFALIFFLLGLNVTQLPWVSAEVLYVILRPTAFVAALAGWAYSFMALHDEFRG